MMINFFLVFTTYRNYPDCLTTSAAEGQELLLFVHLNPTSTFQLCFFYAEQGSTIDSFIQVPINVSNYGAFLTRSLSNWAVSWQVHLGHRERKSQGAQNSSHNPCPALTMWVMAGGTT